MYYFLNHLQSTPKYVRKPKEDTESDFLPIELLQDKALDAGIDAIGTIKGKPKLRLADTNIPL